MYIIYILWVFFVVFFLFVFFFVVVVVVFCCCCCFVFVEVVVVVFCFVFILLLFLFLFVCLFVCFYHFRVFDNNLLRFQGRSKNMGMVGKPETHVFLAQYCWSWHDTTPCLCGSLSKPQKLIIYLNSKEASLRGNQIWWVPPYNVYALLFVSMVRCQNFIFCFFFHSKRAFVR